MQGLGQVPPRGCILALVTDAFGSGGGIAQYNRDFIGALARCVDVESIEILPRLCPDGATGLPQRVRQHPAIFPRVRYSVRALGLAVNRRPGVIFCGHLFMAPMAAAIARLIGARLAIQLHGVEIWRRPSALQRAALKAADMVLCVSSDTRAHAIGWTAISPRRAVIVPNTVADDFTPGEGTALRRQLGVDSKRVLLSVSRLAADEQYKGQDRVIRLINSMRAQGHDVVFLIAGEGDDRARLEALARAQGVADHVRFLGKVPREQLPDLYRAADLFVMPSTGEGFGIVFLEAMACGTPALGLAAGGAVDALGDGLGEAVAEGELQDAMIRMLAAGKPNGQALASKVRERFGRTAFETSSPTPCRPSAWA